MPTEQEFINYKDFVESLDPVNPSASDKTVLNVGGAGPKSSVFSAIATFVHNTWAAFVNALTAKTSFANGDKIPVVNGSTATAMGKDDLLRVTAENVLAGNVAPVFDATKDYVVGDVVERGGKIYRFTADHSAGAWNSSHVENYLVSENVKNLSEAVDLQVVTNDVSLGESNASFTSDPTTNTIIHIVGQTGKIKIADCIVGHRYVVLTSTTSGYDGNTYIQFCSSADGIGYSGSRFNVSGSKLYVTATADYEYMFFNSIMTNAYSQVIGVIDVTGDAELEERVKTERYDVLGASSKELVGLKSRVGVAESEIITNKNDIDSLEHFDELIGEEILDLKKISTPNENVTINADDSVSFNGSSGRVCVAESVANKRLLIFVDKDFPANGNLYFKSNSAKNQTGYAGARYNLPARAEYMVMVPEYTYLLMYSDWTTAFDLNIKIFDVTGNPQFESLLKKLNYLVRFNGVGGICNGYVSDNVNKSIKSFVVDCWGDSLTQSYDENGVVSCLENAISEKLGVRVNNYGNGGEKILDIAARQGGIPFKLASDVSIPATTDPATLSLVSSWDGATAPSSNFIAQGQNGINKCSIAGVDGNISLSGGNIVFTRSASGDAVTAKTGTVVYTDVDKIIGSNIQCIWAGQNDTISDLDEFVEKLRNMCRRYDGERYVVLSPINRPVVSDVITLESTLCKAFGIKAIATRQYLNAYGIDVAISLGLIESATAQDLIDIADGIVPTSLRKDAVHLNSVGYKVLGYEIARILKLLYW